MLEWVTGGYSEEHINDAAFVFFLCLFGIAIAVFITFYARRILKLRVIRKKAGQGDPEQQYILGMRFLDSPLFGRNIQNGLYWLTKAAESGYREAMNQLGFIYFSGDYETVPADYAKAAYWLERAASMGDAHAAYTLGTLYGLDTSSVHDYGKSAFYMKKAALMGHVDASVTLGFMYNEGAGVERDPVRSCAWFLVAAEGGGPTADLDELMAQMSYEDIERAERIAAEIMRESDPVEAVSREDYGEIIEVWEESVRASHNFISEDEINFYRTVIKDAYLAQVSLYCIREGMRITSFIGIKGDSLEMLFVRPGYFRRGYGRRLLSWAVKYMGVSRVDVNEENKGAVEFYRKMGFTVVRRSPVDNEGKPHPILHMELIKSTAEKRPLC